MDASDAFEDASTSGIFALCGNGGSLQFLSFYGDEYSSVGYGYGLEEDQALNDVMGTEYGDSLIGSSKDGAAGNAHQQQHGAAGFVRPEGIGERNGHRKVDDQDEGHQQAG